MRRFRLIHQVVDGDKMDNFFLYMSKGQLDQEAKVISW